MEVWAVRPNAAEGGVKLGEATIQAQWPERLRSISVDVALLSNRNAREALFLVFRSPIKEQSICEIEDFKFAAD